VLALKHATLAYTEIQDQLGISRKKRKEAGEQSVVEYIAKLQSQASEFLEERLEKLKCPDCNLVLAKYHIYIKLKGEPNALAWEDKEIEKIKYRFSVECSKCGAMVEVNQDSTRNKLAS
jgi:hypothetical protein